MPESQEKESGPLVGRENEHAEMVSFVESKMTRKHNTPHVLFVCGACGGGKTTSLRRVMKHDFKASPALDAANVPKTQRRLAFHYFNCADLGRNEMLSSTLTALEKASGIKGLKGAKLTQINTHLQHLAASKKPTQIIALDEAEYARSPKVVQDVTLSVVQHGGGAVGVVLISNSRSVNFLQQDEYNELTFGAYNVEHLARIGKHTGDVEGAHVAGEDVDISTSAAEYAAKVAVTRYSADARKVVAMCKNAVAAKKTKLADSGVGAKRKNSSTHDSDDGPTAAPPVDASVKIGDLVSTIVDAPTTNVPIIRTLPKQMLLILCCCLNYSTRQQERGTSSLDVRGLYAMYQQLMKHLHAVPQSQAHLKESLSGLCDYGLVTPVNEKGVFALVSRRDEIEAALRAEGKMYKIEGQVIQAIA